MSTGLRAKFSPVFRSYSTGLNHKKAGIRSPGFKTTGLSFIGSIFSCLKVSVVTLFSHKNPKILSKLPVRKYRLILTFACTVQMLGIAHQ